MINNDINHDFCADARSTNMRYKEMAKNLIDLIPNSKMIYVLSYLQGAAVPDDTPNEDTLEGINELENGGGTTFSGTTAELFNELMAD